MRDRQRNSRPAQNIKAFSLFHCTNCGLIEDNSFASRSCMECGSNNYIIRYVVEARVYTLNEAIRFYMQELKSQLDRQTRIVQAVTKRYSS